MKVRAMNIQYQSNHFIKMILVMVMTSILANASVNSCREFYRAEKVLNHQTHLEITNSVNEIMKRVENTEFNEEILETWNLLKKRRPELLAKKDFEFGALQSLFSLKPEELMRILDDRTFCHSLTTAINNIPFLKGVTPRGIKNTAYAILLGYYLDKSDAQNIQYSHFKFNDFKVLPYFSRFEYLNAKPKIIKTPTNFIHRIFQRMEYGYDYFEPNTGGYYLKYFEPFNILKIDQDNISVSYPYFKLPFMFDMTIKEIENLTTNEYFLQSVSRQLLKELLLQRSAEFKSIGFGRVSIHNLTEEEVGVSLKKGAQLILAAKKIHDSKAQNTLTLKEFSDLAAIEGLEVQNFPVTFRFDSRSPEEIKTASGFYPNLSKPIGPLLMHSVETSTGARFVSVSTKEANSDVLQTISAGKTAKQAEPTTANSEIKQRLIKQSLREGLFESGENTELLLLYEYKIENITGVEASEVVAIKSEKEIVTPFIKRNNITSVRKVYLLYGRKFVDTIFKERVMSSNPLNIAVEYGAWEPL